MYTKYFNLRQKPFSLNPNPNFVFLSRQHKEAFAHILYGINNRHGFIELLGEVGTGKTTVLRTILGQFQDKNYRFAFIFNPCVSATELLRKIHQEFGITCNARDINSLLNALNNFLLEENHNGRTVVLVIDEAQNLKPEVLEQLRLISNLETNVDKLIQIILSGQPELNTLLRRHDLRQLNQRIAVRCKLGALNRSETGAYIRHRLKIAGAGSGSRLVFSDLAILMIHMYSRGIPRMINILCDRALLTAYADSRHTVSPLIAYRAIKELNSSTGKTVKRAFIFVSISLFLSALVILVLWKNNQAPQDGDYSPREKPPKVVFSKPLENPLKKIISPKPTPSSNPKTGNTSEIQNLEEALSLREPTKFNIDAVNKIMTRWRSTPIAASGETLSIPSSFEKIAADRHLRLIVFHGSLDEVVRFDLPFLAVIQRANKTKQYYLAITSVNGETLSIHSSLHGVETIKKNALAQASNGVFYIFWRDSAYAQDNAGYNGIRRLQFLLKQAGYYHLPIDGAYNSATIKALRQYQISQGIPVDGSGGDLTMASLSKYDTNHKTPSLTES